MARKKSDIEIVRSKKEPISAWLSSGCTILDLALANQLPGGFGTGRVHHIYGWESSTKSVIGTEVLGSAQRKGGHVWFLDAEETLDFDRAKTLFGLDVDADTFHYDVPPTIEDLFDGSKEYTNSIADIIKFITDNNIKEPCAVTVDSLSALPSSAELKEKLAEGSYKMSRAKQISSAYRKYLKEINNVNLTVIMINQARVNINASMFGDKMVVSGGKALDFYASTSTSLKMVGKIDNTNKQVVGCNFKFEVKKNKTAPPHKKGEFRLLFDIGIDDVATNLEWLKDINEWNNYRFGDFSTSRAGPVSLEEAVHYIEDNDLMFALEDEVAKVWKEAYTVPERKERERRN